MSRVSWRPLAAPRAPLPPGDIGYLFVNVTLVEFAPPLRRRSLLVVCHVGLGSTTALETGRMLGICISSFAPRFHKHRFGQVLGRLFRRDLVGFGSRISVDFWSLTFSTQGESGQARHPCELGTPTHADAGELTPLRAGNLHPCFRVSCFRVLELRFSVGKFASR